MEIMFIRLCGRSRYPLANKPNSPLPPAAMPMITANSWSGTKSNLTQLKYKEPGCIHHVNVGSAHEPKAEAEFQHERAYQAGEYRWTYAVRRRC